MINWNSLSASEFTKAVQEFLTTHPYDDGDHHLLDSNQVWQRRQWSQLNKCMSQNKIEVVLQWFDLELACVHISRFELTSK